MAVDEAQVRLFIWDKGAAPILSTEEVTLLIDLSAGILERAVALGWAVKGGYYSQMIDIQESGSQRMLSQLYKNAERQHKLWDEKAVVIEETIGLSTTRVAPQGFSIFGNPDASERISIFTPNEPLNLRMFPLKRMFAIKQ